MLIYWLLLLLCALPAVTYRRVAWAYPSGQTTASAMNSGEVAARGGSAGFRKMNLGAADKPSVAFLIVGVLIALLIGFRFEIGTDWENYQLIFLDISSQTFTRAVTIIDPGYAALNWVVSRLSSEIWPVNLVCAAIFAWGLVSLANQMRNPWLALTVATPYLVIVVAMGYTRQSAAIGFCMLAMTAIMRNSFVRFAFFVILAATFHRSAMILLPLGAFSYGQGRGIKIILAVFVGIFGYYFIIAPEIATYIERYSNARLESRGTLLRLLMNIVPALVFVSLSRRFRLSENERRLWLSLAAIGIISLAVYPFVPSSTALDRLSLYVVPIQLFVLSTLPELFSVGSRLFLKIMVIIYSATIQLIWLAFSYYAINWVPYRAYWM